MAFRQELGYPPYLRLILFHLAGNVEEKTLEAAQRLASKCQKLLQQRPEFLQELQMLGLKGKHRWHLLLKSKKSTPLLEVGRQLVNWGYGEFKGFGVNLTADVDPISLI
jgi:primosomal protein N' (replication factor Y)